MEKRRTRKFYNWTTFINQCKYYTKKQLRAPYKMIFMGPDAEKISKEIDNEI